MLRTIFNFHLIHSKDHEAYTAPDVHRMWKRLNFCYFSFANPNPSLPQLHPLPYMPLDPDTVHHVDTVLLLFYLTTSSTHDFQSHKLYLFTFIIGAQVDLASDILGKTLKSLEHKVRLLYVHVCV